MYKPRGDVYAARMDNELIKFSSPVIHPVPSQLLSDVPDNDTGIRSEVPRVPDGYHESVKAVIVHSLRARGTRRVELSVDDGVSGALPEVTDPEFCCLDIGCVEDEFLSPGVVDGFRPHIFRVAPVAQLCEGETSLYL